MAQRLRQVGQEPGGVPPVAPAGVRAGLPLEPEFDDVRIAGRYHNPAYGLFTVVTFMPRVWRNSKRSFRDCRCEEALNRQIGALFIDPTKRRGPPAAVLSDHRAGEGRNRRIEVLFYGPDKTMGFHIFP